MVIRETDPIRGSLSSFNGGSLMSQKYENILVAVDGSERAELAFLKSLSIAKRNDAHLTIANVVDTRALQSVTAFDAEVYEQLQDDAQKLLDKYEEKAHEAGVENVVKIVEFGNPKTLLATEIPDEYKIDLILVGATGLNGFERLLVGSTSEYILRHAKVDLLVVREPEKVL